MAGGSSTRRDLLLAAGASLIAAGASGRTALADDPVAVTAILPLSGGLALFGRQARIGLDLARSEINSGGGILGRPIAITYADDRSDPTRGAELVREATDNNAPIAIVGPVSSAVRDAMMPEVAKAKVPLLYATNYEGAVCNPYFFCFNTVPNQETGFVVPWLAKQYGKRFFMLGADYVWPRKMFETAATIVGGLGGETLGSEFTAFGTDDFLPVIQRIKQAAPDILLLAIPGTDGVTFMRQANLAGLFDTIALNFMGFEQSYLDEIGPITGKGLYAATPIVDSADVPGVKTFVDAVHQQEGLGVAASQYALTHYNALRALRLGLEKAGSVDREAAIAGMAGLTFASPTGPVTIDPDNHHVTMTMFLGKAAGLDFTVVKPLGEIAPEPHCPA